MIIFVVLYVFLGWVGGIAINHAADLLPRRQTLRQWPCCASCHTAYPYLAWSSWGAYLTGQQKCAHCGAQRKTFIRSIMVELALPALFIFLLSRYDFSFLLAIISVYTAILVLITVTDLEHRLIFNVVILPAILLGIIMGFFTPNYHWPVALAGGLVGFVISYLALLFARGGFGEGDVTLSTFLGLIIGFPYILLSLVFGVFLGGFVAFLLLVTRRAGLKTFIPYGPFLTITGWIMLIWRYEIWDYYF